MPLIERSKKKFTLTKEGDTLYKYSKQIIQHTMSFATKFRNPKCRHRDHQGGDNLQHRPPRTAAYSKNF